MIIQAFKEPATGRLTEAELDAAIEPWHLPAHSQQIEHERARSPAPRIPRSQRVHRIPMGCHQQGRFPMAFGPAEACTELGADDDEHQPLLSDSEKALLVVIVVASLSIVAALALHLWRAAS